MEGKMKIVDINDFEVIEEEGGLFKGGKVKAQFLINEKTPAKNVHVGMIKFSPGARTKFHVHTNEQILFVTEGKGIVATKDEEVVVTPGMVIYLPPDEVHMHGATEDSSFAHLTILGQPHELEVAEQ